MYLINNVFTAFIVFSSMLVGSLVLLATYRWTSWLLRKKSYFKQLSKEFDTKVTMEKGSRQSMLNLVGIGYVVEAVRAANAAADYRGRMSGIGSEHDSNAIEEEEEEEEGEEDEEVEVEKREVEEEEEEEEDCSEDTPLATERADLEDEEEESKEEEEGGRETKGHGCVTSYQQLASIKHDLPGGSAWQKGCVREAASFPQRRAGYVVVDHLLAHEEKLSSVGLTKDAAGKGEAGRGEGQEDGWRSQSAEVFGYCTLTSLQKGNISRQEVSCSYSSASFVLWLSTLSMPFECPYYNTPHLIGFLTTLATSRPSISCVFHRKQGSKNIILVLHL